MNTTVIVLIVIGIIAIIVSCIMTTDNDTMNDEEKAEGKAGGEGAGSEEKVNPNLKKELTEADKKQLRKLTDNFISDYSKKKVKDTVSKNIDNAINDKMKNSDKIISQKIEKSISEIDDRASENTGKLEEYYNEISTDIEKNRAELKELYNKVSEKEKEIKTSLSVVDEYRQGLDKLKAEAGNLLIIKDDMEAISSSLDAKKQEIEELLAKEPAFKAEPQVQESEAEAEVEEEVEEDLIIEGGDSENESEPAEEQSAEAETVNLEKVVNDDQTEELIGEDPQQEAPAEEASTEGAQEDTSDFEAEDEKVVRFPGKDKLSKKNKKNKKNKKKNKETEESEAEESETEELVAEAEVADAEEAIEAEAVEPETDNNEGLSEDESQAATQNQDGVEELMPIEEPVAEDSADEFEDFDDRELSGLDEVENLDEILDREGIYITEGDTVGNVIAMYSTGFSIIEISKVLKIEVGEVKSIIDMNQGD